MPLPLSSLAIACNEINAFLRTSLNAAANNIDVHMGSPSEVPDSEDRHRLNLFFYRFEPSAFQAAAYPNDPWRVRIFCLITAFGVDEDSILAGENELRIIGEIMRIFREKPVSDAFAAGPENVRLQTVFTPATDEQVNQVWSTQGDTAFRPSVIYEFALAPIMPLELRNEPSLVGGLGFESRAEEDGRYDGFSGVESHPVVAASFVNVANPQWQPRICWVYQDALHETLSLNVDSPEFGSFIPAVWIAGDPAESVDLYWQTWDSGSGWTDITSPIAANPNGTVIDPEEIPPSVPASFPIELSLPVTIPVGENAAQALLYAQREVTLAPGMAPIIVRSNPLLISLYRVT